jgi:hypothetical protein
MKMKSIWFGLLIGAALTSITAAVPALRFSTFIGGSGDDAPLAIASDPNGFIYTVGYTSSSDLPGANFIDPNGNCFVQKLSADGSSVVYTALIGGCMPRAVAVNSAGEAFVAGHTFSAEDAVLIKLNAAGNQALFRKSLGGSGADAALAVAIDPVSGKIWLTGVAYSSDFPTAGEPFQRARGGDFNAFLARYSADGSTLEYSSFLGGPEGIAMGSGLALDSQGRPVVCGWTGSPLFPMLNPVRTFAGGADAFVARFDLTGRTLLSSTFLGGNSVDAASKCALDAIGNIYVTGFTLSSDFPTQSAAQPSLAGLTDAFVTKLNPDATAIIYSTFLGSSLDDIQRGWPTEFGPNSLALNTGGIAVSPDGRALVAGSTYGPDFLKLNPLKGENEPYALDGFATLLEPDGAVGFSTYLGGANGDNASAVARAGDGFAIAGFTATGWRLPVFPRTSGSSQGFTLTSLDGFVLKLDTSTPPLSNDSFASAASLEGLESTVFVHTGNATKEIGEPNHAGNAGGKSVWFRWTPPASGRVIITTRGSSFPTVTALYRGTSLENLQLAASSADRPEGEIRQPITAGETVYIAVDGKDGASGNLFLSVSTSLPPNDEFADRSLLIGENATATGSNVGSSSEIGEPGQRTIWWKWTAPSTGAFTITTLGSTFPTWLAIYTGNSIENLRFITDNLYYTNENARLTIKAEAGVEYQIQVSGDDGATGDVNLSLFPANRPSNDDFANRTRLGNLNELVTGTDFDAAFDPVEWAIENQAQITYGSGRMVWWEWTSPINGAVEINTTNSVTQITGTPIVTKMVVFSGDTFPPAANDVIAAFDPAERVPASIYLTDVHAGTHYQIGIDTVPWEQPALFSLKIRAVAPPRIIPGSVQIDATRTFRARAQGVQGKNYKVVASMNLLNWELISNHPNITGEFAFESPVGAGYRFFRIEEVP